MNIKSLVFRLIGLTMVVLADIGSGLIAVRILTKVVGLNDLWWVYLLGVSLALSLDADMVITKFTANISTIEHRDLFHRPLYFLPFLAAGLLTTGLWSFWCLLVFTTAWLHLLHDSIDDTNWWGIKWLKPFSNDSWLFFSHRNGESGSWHVINRFSVVVYKNFKPRVMPLDNWLWQYFLRPTPESVGSTVYFIICVAVIAFWR